MKKTCCWLFALALLLGIGSCKRSAKPAVTGGKVNVVCSILPLTFFANQIGGEHVNVTALLPPGASPASFDLKPAQMKQLAAAQVFIRVRVPFEEAWMDKIRAANKQLKIIDLTEGIERVSQDHHDAAEPGGHGANPHIWLSLKLAKKQVRTICTGFCEVDPTHKKVYEEYTSDFLELIDAQDRIIQATLAGLKNRTFMVFHPAWTYFAMDYKLEQIPIEVEGKEPSAAEMADLMHTAKNKGLRAIFVQPQFDHRMAQTIARQLNIELKEADPLAADWLDNLLRFAQTLAALDQQAGE